jgi:hypothetical protein
MNASSFRDALELVDTLRQQRRFAEALQSVESLLREEGISSEVLVRRAILQQLDAGAHSLEQIEGDLRLAQLRSPGHLEAQLELGHFLYAVRDQPSEALPHFRSARTRACASLREAFLGEIKCHADLGDWASVTRVLDEAEETFPGDLDLSLLRAEYADAATRPEAQG